ncbi:hypothetical protein QCA50_017367 [Cerrena zonata]|uniref:BTB domain-containing protein n=1 Tax=Cerrena zonata TaxID=2478898 RepID=A0AAW0FKX5_9APHY
MGEPDAYKIDEEFYFDIVYLLVEGYLYKLPKRTLIDNSETFRDMFSVPQSDAVPAEGSSKDLPIRLDQIERVDFVPFLKILFPLRQAHGLRRASEWISVLKLASLWMCDGVREEAIAVLKEHYAKDHIRSLEISMKFDVKEWMLSSLGSLAIREEPIEAADAEVVGIECALRICKLREKGMTDMIRGTTFSSFQRRPFDYSTTIKSIFPECA